jgi:hypothetical protein
VIDASSLRVKAGDEQETSSKQDRDVVAPAGLLRRTIQEKVVNEVNELLSQEGTNSEE